MSCSPFPEVPIAKPLAMNESIQWLKKCDENDEQSSELLFETTTPPIVNRKRSLSLKECKQDENCKQSKMGTKVMIVFHLMYKKTAQCSLKKAKSLLTLQKHRTSLLKF